MALVVVVTAILGATACTESTDGPSAHHIRWGAYLPDLMGSDITSDAGIVGVTTLANRPLDLILTFSALHDPVPLERLSRIMDTGATPVITIEPWRPDGGVDQPDHRLRPIADGEHDSDLSRWAKALAAWGHPVLVRFAHEMNGTWYPWAVGVNGNTAADYRAAWIHMHDLMRAEGADLVRFVWAPMTAIPGISDFESAYPGDDYVDEIGVDGYNWGDDGTHGWASPDYLFTASLARLRALAPSKPILIAEVGSADSPDPARKAAWISEFVTLATTEPGVDGFIWFQANKERDWRFNSNPHAANAFRSAVTEVPDP